VHVEVVYAEPDQQHRVHLELEKGATVALALAAVSRIAPFSSLDLAQAGVGVFGRLVTGSEVLQPDDRLEIYRPLLMDPKEARRLRAGGQDG